MKLLNPATTSLTFFAAAAFSASASAQVTFSVDNGSAAVGTGDAFSATPITEGDILTPSTGPAPGPNGPALAAPTPPGISISSGPGGLGLAAWGGCVGHGTATPCPIELDALSYGNDARIASTTNLPGAYWFSVDEVARGMPGSPLPPTVFTEGSLTGAFEAAGDMFMDLGGAPAPMPPFAGAAGNTGMIDGNGFISASGFVYPGLGLVEPGGLWPFIGDDVDAADTDAAVAKATELGAQVLMPAIDTPFGRVAGLSDPQGAAFRLITLTPQD